MTTHAQTRKSVVNTLMIAAILLWGMIGAARFVSGNQTDTHPDMGKPVLSGFAERRLEASRISFTMADEQYTLERTNSGWVMAKEDGFPVRQDRLGALAAGLETLTYGPRRTADPDKHDLVRLGHPENSGTGVLIEVFGRTGERTDAIIVGRKNGQLYVRKPDGDQTYRAGGNLPPFYNRRAWLDFEIIDIAPDAVRSVRLSDRLGQTGYFSRPVGGNARSFTTAPPYQDLEVASRLSLSTTALAITRFAPEGAKLDTNLTTAPVARHISETFDGLEIDLSAYQEPDGLWVTLRAIEAGEGARRAEAINEKVEGWAFRLSPFDWQDFTPALDTLVVNPAPSPEAPPE